MTDNNLGGEKDVKICKLRVDCSWRRKRRLNARVMIIVISFESDVNQKSRETKEVRVGLNILQKDLQERITCDHYA